MIDPKNITNFDRTDNELEEFALFAIAVAGKSAKTIAPALDRTLKYIKEYLAMSLWSHRS